MTPIVVNCHMQLGSRLSLASITSIFQMVDMGTKEDMLNEGINFILELKEVLYIILVVEVKVAELTICLQAFGFIFLGQFTKF